MYLLTFGTIITFLETFSSTSTFANMSHLALTTILVRTRKLTFTVQKPQGPLFAVTKDLPARELIGIALQSVT